MANTTPAAAPSPPALLLHFLLLLLLSMIDAQRSQYCKICPNHTLCKYQAVSTKCHDVGSTVLDDEHKEEILREHNRLRGLIALGQEQRGLGPQPPASNMLKMQWDEELARVALIWAQQCNYGHDVCRDVERFPVGQNVAIRWTTNPKNDWEWSWVIQSWFDEVKQFNPKDIEPFQFDHRIGHYSQMVWADTFLVGCANIYYKQQTKHYRYYVCNYGPAGNEISIPVSQAWPGYVFPKLYKIGSACTDCPKNTKCCTNEPGLCCKTSSSLPTSQKQPATTTTTTTTNTPTYVKNKIYINNTIPVNNNYYYHQQQQQQHSYYTNSTAITTTPAKKVYNYVFSFYTTKKPNSTTTSTKKTNYWSNTPTTTIKPPSQQSVTEKPSPENRLKIWLSYFTPRHFTTTTTTQQPYYEEITSPPTTIASITNKTPRTPLDIYSFFKIY